MLCVSDAEMLLQLIKDIDIPAQLLNLIDQMIQKPNVRQVILSVQSSLLCTHIKLTVSATGNNFGSVAVLFWNVHFLCSFAVILMLLPVTAILLSCA